MTAPSWSGGSGRFAELPFRRLFVPLKRPVPNDAEIVTAYTDGQVTLRANRSKIGYHEAADLSGFQGVEPGDFVVHGLDIMRGSVGVSDSSGAISAVCTVCAPAADVEPRFMAYAIRAQALQGYPKALARGVREGGADFRRWDTLAELRLPVPPLDEQRRVADFVDHQVGLLNQALSLRQEQMDLLAARGIATMADSLTGGGAPATSPTGTPWLPLIPDAWSMGPVWAFYDVQLGKMLNPERAAGAHPAPYLRNANVHWFDISITDLAVMSFEPDERDRYRVLPGDLMVCEGGAGIGEAAVWQGEVDECYYSKSLHRVRATGDLPVEWLLYWLRVAKHVGLFEAGGNLSTIPHLTGEQLRAYRIPVPPARRSSLNHIREELATLRNLEGLIAGQVSLLAERKRALITAAVTGQLDVTTARSVA